MTPDLYGSLSDDEGHGLCVHKPDVEDQRLKLVETTFGPTAFVQLGEAPSFIKANCSAEVSYFSSPDRIEIVLSRSLRPSHAVVRNAIGAKFRNVALVIRGLDLANWCYVGSATLTSTFGTAGVHWKHTYRLDPRLPYELWLRVNGFKRWLLALGGREYQCANVDECIALVSTEWGGSESDVQLTRYEGDSLLAITNADGDCVVFYCRDDECERTSRKLGCSADPEDDVTFYTSASHDVVAKASWIISRRAALSIIERFVATGDPGEMTE